MATHANVTKALDPRKLPKLSTLAVVALEAEDYTDSMGEAAIRVTAILDEAVDIEKVKGEEVSELKYAIHQQLRDGGIALIPYIFLVKRSELEEPDEE